MTAGHYQAPENNTIPERTTCPNSGADSLVTLFGTCFKPGKPNDVALRALFSDLELRSVCSTFKDNK